MKKTLITYTKIIALCLIVALGVGYAFAADWTPPQGTAPTNNVDTPVHTGSGAQSKLGGLSVEAFAAFQNAQFQQKTFLRGSIFGDAPDSQGVPPSNSTVKFGDTAGIVSLLINGGLNVKGTIQSDTVANSGNKNLCADAAGVIKLCDAESQTPQNSGGAIVKPLGKFCEGKYSYTFYPTNAEFAATYLPPANFAGGISSIQIYPEMNPDTRAFKYTRRVDFSRGVSPSVEVTKAVTMDSLPPNTPTIYDVWSPLTTDSEYGGRQAATPVGGWNNVSGTITYVVGDTGPTAPGKTVSFNFMITASDPRSPAYTVCYK